MAELMTGLLLKTDGLMSESLVKMERRGGDGDGGTDDRAAFKDKVPKELMSELLVNIDDAEMMGMTELMREPVVERRGGVSGKHAAAR